MHDMLCVNKNRWLRSTCYINLKTLKPTQLQSAALLLQCSNYARRVWNISNQMVAKLADRQDKAAGECRRCENVTPISLSCSTTGRIMPRANGVSCFSVCLSLLLLKIISIEWAATNDFHYCDFSQILKLHGLTYKYSVGGGVCVAVCVGVCVCAQPI